MGKKYKQQSGIELDTRYIIGPITSIFSGWCGTWKLCVSMFKHFKRQNTMITQIRMICPSNNHDVYRLVVSQIRNHPTCWFIIGRIVCTSILGWFTKGPTWLMTRMVYSVLYQILKSYHIIYHFISLICQMCPNHWSVKAGAFSSSPPSTASPETPTVPVLDSQLLRLLAPAPPRKSQDVTEMTPLYRVSWRISSRFGGSKWRFPLW